ncbi:methionine adenosyltransferase [Streptomonospora nanhaiensis]|uniref:S-adenosylmethionine synthetase n=1 Tax=Streptomonospora nanhaiensis TaxID=1323731 RepID=A0A853BUT6_9ACTN|nr:methionine adenosyltransferase [Streptomonospora nanhaiensis]MBV2366210.1 hypothetical protein [Streptomonospora nanhaiensis]NYI98277.1 S-adenosylmethionine synthetase [Streptomonospora nanhaiensis]
MHLSITPGLLACGQMPVEVVERKGAGHPDTLADGVAEAVSRAYARYCLDHFGAILHHNSDKTALLGGAAHVEFGRGEMTRPLTVLVNGRFTEALGAKRVPVAEIIDTTVRAFLTARLPRLDPDRDIQVQMRLSTASSPGAVHGDSADQQAGRKHWFHPRTLDDLAERHRAFANDTSAGVGYAPLGAAEQLVLAVEQYLTGEFASANPWCGTDVKVMAVRSGRQVHLTACVPQIADHTPDLDTYVRRRDQVRALIASLAHQVLPSDHQVHVALNTRDDDERRELYLTATGSSIESGDEGVVGRGNRPTGLISMLRPMSMEGVSGKNPVYHVGKLYSLAAQRAAEALHERTGHACAVVLVSQSGRNLDDPWQAVVHTSAPALPELLVRQVIGHMLGEGLEEIRSGLLAGKVATA